MLITQQFLNFRHLSRWFLKFNVDIWTIPDYIFAWISKGVKFMEQSKKRLSCNILVVLLMGTLLFIFGSLAGAVLTSFSINLFHVQDYGIWIIGTYLPFIGIGAVILIYTRITGKDIFHLYFRGSRGNNLKMLTFGLLTGFGMNGACILVAFLHGDIRLEVGSISLLWLVIAFLVVFIQSATEELLFRGYLFYYIRERYGALLALILSSLLFSVLHVGNDGVTALALINIAAIGLFYALSVQYLDSLWFAMANHAMWNFTQNLIFGLPNSGLAADASVFAPVSAKSSLCYDASFGVEASLPATVICLAGAAAVVLWARRNQSAKIEAAA